MDCAHNIRPFIFLARAFVMGQKLVLVIGQVVCIKRERPLFKFKEPRNALFCALKAVLDVLLNDGPVSRLGIQDATGRKGYLLDTLLQMSLAELTKMLVHEFLHMFGERCVNSLAKYEGRCSPFLGRGVNEGLLYNEWIIAGQFAGTSPVKRKPSSTVIKKIHKTEQNTY